MQGCILSGESVTLTNGFEINAGAEVYIDVKDMHCNDRGSISESQEKREVNYMPHKISSMLETSSATKVLRNGQILILRDGKTFTTTGQRVE
jgi:hypothetical protein